MTFFLYAPRGAAGSGGAATGSNPGESTNEEAGTGTPGPGTDAQATINGINEAAGTNQANNAPADPTKPAAPEEPQAPQADPPAKAEPTAIFEAEPDNAESLFNKAVEGGAINAAIEHLKSLGYTVFRPAEAEAQPATMTEEDKEAALTAKYGEGYVSAERHIKGQQPEKTYFTKYAWDNLDGDKGGWKKAVKIPPEVEEIYKRKLQNL